MEKKNNMAEKNVTVTVKTKHGSLVTIRGDEPEEFVNRVTSADNAGFNLAVQAFEELIISAPVNAVQVIASTLGATVISETPVSTDSFAPVAPPVQQVPAGVETVEDRWGNKWTYGRADAPICPNGPMVLKSATNMSGKPYVGFFDPAGGPRWQGAKIPTDQQTAPKFGVKV
jgi:hypothetical protein